MSKRLTNDNSKEKPIDLIVHQSTKGLAAYDFLLLRKDAYESEEIIDAANFWKKTWERNADSQERQ